jgi:hypothetical protein
MGGRHAIGGARDRGAMRMGGATCRRESERETRVEWSPVAGYVISCTTVVRSACCPPTPRTRARARTHAHARTAPHARLSAPQPLRRTAGSASDGEERVKGGGRVGRRCVLRGGGGTCSVARPRTRGMDQTRVVRAWSRPDRWCFTRLREPSPTVLPCPTPLTRPPCSLATWGTRRRRSRWKWEREAGDPSPPCRRQPARFGRFQPRRLPAIPKCTA